MIGIVMGSVSDWPVMKAAADILHAFGVPWEARVLSAHRTPNEMFQYAETAISRGLVAIIAGAGGSAHLPGMMAAKTDLPVIAVPMPTPHLAGQGPLASILEMPDGVPLATMSIGGAGNAARFVVRMLAQHDRQLALAQTAARERMHSLVLNARLPDVP